MHSRNPYRIPPDFAKLAESYGPLKKHLIQDSNSGRTTIDFKDEEALRRLTEAIMLRDFDVKLTIPKNRLCPPVPNRMNYVLWIQDIVYAHQTVLKPHQRQIRGIDIGTGANAIYPFIACKLELAWDMLATELDDESYHLAQKNVTSNALQDRIHVKKASVEGPILFPLAEDGDPYFDFTMCNPPFYGSAEEILRSAEEKELVPNAACTGADIEMIYHDGGEAGFVTKMIQESESFQTRCKWYTSMVGKMTSVSAIVERLRELSISNYAITEFVQGQTRRWAVAWSYSDTRLPDSVARIPLISTKHALYQYMPPKNTLAQPFPRATILRLQQALFAVLDSMSGVLATRISDEEGLFLVEAQQNTWSRSARRNKRQPHAAAASANETPSLTPDIKTASSPGLTCSCRIVDANGDAEDQGEDTGFTRIEFQWIFGQDRKLFESFLGHVSRKVKLALQQ